VLSRRRRRLGEGFRRVRGAGWARPSLPQPGSGRNRRPDAAGEGGRPGDVAGAAVYLTPRAASRPAPRALTPPSTARRPLEGEQRALTLEAAAVAAERAAAVDHSVAGDDHRQRVVTGVPGCARAGRS